MHDDSVTANGIRKTLRVLALGDVVGKPGRRALTKALPDLLLARNIDFCVVNGENVAGGSGVTEKLFHEMIRAGADVVTTGDHIWKKQKVEYLLQKEKRLLRPHNYSPRAAGSGVVVIPARSGTPVGVINLMGRVYMSSIIDDPFVAAEKALEYLKGKTRLIFVDIHAETTSEKQALGRFLDGRVTAVWGTHTHVQTADETVFPKGTAYLTDLGMTGPHDSILGRKVDNVLQRYLTHMYVRFDVASGDVRLSGALVEADLQTGRALSIERVNIKVPLDEDA
jgi:metallophosphoesterase (TIGR00282 family)